MTLTSQDVGVEFSEGETSSERVDVKWEVAVVGSYFSQMKLWRW